MKSDDFQTFIQSKKIFRKNLIQFRTEILDYLKQLQECPKCKRFSVVNNGHCEYCEYPDCNYGDIFHIP